MVGLSILGALVFGIFNSMYSIGFDILIKILEYLSTLYLNRSDVIEEIMIDFLLIDFLN